MASASAANQPSNLHKYHCSTLWESPSNLHPTEKVNYALLELQENKSW